MVKAVIFDFGQTLVDSADGFRTAEREAQDRIFAALEGIERDRFMDVYRRVRKAHHERSRLSRLEIWRSVCHALERSIDERWLVAWEGEYWKRVNALTRVFPETPGTLETLCVTHRLALISNTQGQTGGSAHRLSGFPDLERMFECIVIAGENGIPAKPDAQPFLHCLRQMNLDAGDCFYVGDDYRFDVCGSREVGMRPVWLKHHSVNRTWPDVDTVVPVITSLEELPGLCAGARASHDTGARRQHLAG